MPIIDISNPYVSSHYGPEIDAAISRVIDGLVMENVGNGLVLLRHLEQSIRDYLDGGTLLPSQYQGTWTPDTLPNPVEAPGNWYVSDSSVGIYQEGARIVSDGTVWRALPAAPYQLPGAGEVTQIMLEPGAVGTAAIEDRSVTMDKIAFGAVNSGELADFAVGTEHLQDNVVTEDKLSNLVTEKLLRSRAHGLQLADLDMIVSNNLSWSQFASIKDGQLVFVHNDNGQTMPKEDWKVFFIFDSSKIYSASGNPYASGYIDLSPTPASSTAISFNGNRVITGDLGVKGDNLGGATLNEFIERVFFPAVSPNVTFNFSPTNPSEFGIDRTFTFVLGGNTNDGEVEGGIVFLNGTGTTLGTINPVGVNTAINQSFAYTHDGYPDDEGIRSEVELILNGDTSVIFPEATLTWVNPYFYGSIPTNDLGANHLDNNGADSIGGTDFTKALWTKSTRTISYSPSSERMIFAYPASYGNLTGIKDANGFDIMTLFIKHPTYIYTNAANEGVPYNFYYSASETTQTNFNITFEV